MNVLAGAWEEWGGTRNNALWLGIDIGGVLCVETLRGDFGSEKLLPVISLGYQIQNYNHQWPTRDSTSLSLSLTLLVGRNTTHHQPQHFRIRFVFYRSILVRHFLRMPLHLRYRTAVCGEREYCQTEIWINLYNMISKHFFVPFHFHWISTSLFCVRPSTLYFVTTAIDCVGTNLIKNSRLLFCFCSFRIRKRNDDDDYHDVVNRRMFAELIKSWMHEWMFF